MIQEQHEKQFKGWWTPEYVVSLFENETISIQEMVLLSMIDSLARTDIGCCASNEYLGSKMRISADRVKRLISHLKELGLLIQISFDGRKRFLGTYWSRNPNSNRGNDEVVPTDRVKTPCLTGYKQPSRQGENTPSVGLETPCILYKGIRQVENTISPPAGGDVTCEPSSPTQRKHQPSKWDQRAAEELNRIVSSVIKVNSRADLKQWAKQFCLMREIDKVDKKVIRETIEWYAKHIGEEYCVEAFSASTFRTKFKQGKFAGAMRRSKNGDVDNTDEPEVEYEIISV